MYILILLPILHEFGAAAAIVAAAVACNRPEFEAWLGNVSQHVGFARGTALKYLRVMESHGYLKRGKRGWTTKKKYTSLSKEESIKLPKDVSRIHGISPAQKIIIGYILSYPLHSHDDMQLTTGLDDTTIRNSIKGLLSLGYIEKIVEGGGRGKCRQYKVKLPGIEPFYKIDTSYIPTAKTDKEDEYAGIKLCEYTEALAGIRARYADAAYFDVDLDVLEAATTGMAKFLARPPFVIGIHGVEFSYNDAMLFEKYADLPALQTVNARIRRLRENGGYIDNLETYVRTALLTEAHDFAVDHDIPTRLHPGVRPF